MKWKARQHFKSLLMLMGGKMMGGDQENLTPASPGLEV